MNLMNKFVVHYHSNKAERKYMAKMTLVCSSRLLRKVFFQMILCYERAKQCSGENK